MYKRISKVRELLEEYTNMKQTIRTKIFELMDELEQNLDEKGVHTFQQACRVISALKDKSKDDMGCRLQPSRKQSAGLVNYERFYSCTIHSLRTSSPWSGLCPRRFARIFAG